MATLFEQRQAKQQQKEQFNQLIRSGIDTARQVVERQLVRGGLVEPVGGAAAIINAVSGIGLAAFQFIRTRRTARRQQRKQEELAESTNFLTNILDVLEEHGNLLIAEGYVPNTPEFETLLSEITKEVTGYKGYCNAEVYSPPGEGPRKLWFTATNNGALVVATSDWRRPPPNLQSYWYSRCKNMHDRWVEQYQKLLIQQGRAAEIQEIEDIYSSRKLYFQIGSGVAFSVLFFLLVRNALKIK